MSVCTPGFKTVTGVDQLPASGMEWPDHIALTKSKRMYLIQHFSVSRVGHLFSERTWFLDFAGKNNCIDNMQLHVRMENSGIQAGCFEWCLRFDCYQCCKHYRGSHSSLASTKKAHFPITLSESLWCRFGFYPSGHHLLTWMTSKTFYQIEFSHSTWPSWQFAMECIPSQLWKKWLPSFFTLYFLSFSLVSYMPYGCFTLPCCFLCLSHHTSLLSFDQKIICLSQNNQ